MGNSTNRDLPVGIHPTVANSSPNNSPPSSSNENRHRNVADRTSVFRQLLLPTPGWRNQQNAVAGSTDKTNYTDDQLIDFFKQPDGDRFLQREIIRKPVHILADFNYIPLNFDLDAAADERGPSQQSPGRANSGSAKMWARNSDARVWRDWVANCVMFENYIGIEDPQRNQSDPRTYKNVNGDNDKMVMGLDSDHGRISDFSNSNATARNEINQVFSKILEVYALLYNVDEYLIQALFSQPRQKVGARVRAKNSVNMQKFSEQIYGDDRVFDEYWSRISSFKNFSNYDDASASTRNNTIDYDSLKANFRFTNADSQVRNFKFDRPDRWEFFIKSASESLRNINHYIEEMEFVYNGVEGAEFESNNNTYSGVKTESIVSKLIEDNIYSSAIKIRRKLLKAKRDFNNSSSGIDLNLDIKSPLEHAGKLVLSQGRSVGGRVTDIVEDDVQKILARTLIFDNNGKKAVTFAPFLMNDMLQENDSTIIHYLTLKDILLIKKSQLFALIENIKASRGNIESSISDFNRKVQALSTFPFENGPASLLRLIEVLINGMCPIQGALRTRPPVDESIALVLLDPRNIVAHMTKCRVGKHIYDLSLLSSHYAAQGTRSRNTKLSNYTVGFFKAGINNANAVSALGMDPRRRNEISLFSQNQNTGAEIEDGPGALPVDGSAYGTTMGVMSRIGAETRSLINSSVIRGVSSAIKRKYIFFLVMYQLANADNQTGATGLAGSGSPYFSTVSTRFSSVADSLNSQYNQRINTNIFRDDAKNPTRKYFRSQLKFTDVEIEDKIGIINDLRQDMLLQGFDNNNLIGGLWDNVANLRDGLEQLPRNIQSVFQDYKTNVLNAIFEGTDRMNPHHPGFADSVQNFMGSGDWADNYALVIQDFLMDDAGRYNPGISEHSYRHQEVAIGRGPITSRTRSNPGTAKHTRIVTDSDNLVRGVRGVGSGGPRERAGFSSLHLNDGVIESVIDKLKEKILTIDRDTNFLIMLSEAICAQLFYGYPTDDSFSKKVGPSAFNDNSKGIFGHLDMISRSPDKSGERNINIPDEDLFDVVWEYVKIAEAFTDELPRVKLKFHQVENAEGERVNSSEYYQVSEATQRFERTSADSQTLQDTLRRYTPSHAGEAELADQLNDYLARANEYFKIAETQMSKEPVFQMGIEPFDRSIDEWTSLAVHSRSGFLPHVSINSEFTRKKISLFSDGHHYLKGTNIVMSNTETLYNRCYLQEMGDYNDFWFGCIPKKFNYKEMVERPAARGSGSRTRSNYTSVESALNTDLSGGSPFNSSPPIKTYFGYWIDPWKLTDQSNYRGYGVDRHEKPDFNGDISGIEEDNLREYYTNRIGMLPPAWYNQLMEKMPVISDIQEQATTFRGSMDQFRRENTSDWVSVIPLSDPEVSIVNKLEFTIRLKKKTYTFCRALKCRPDHDHLIDDDGNQIRIIEQHPGPLAPGPGDYRFRGRTYRNQVHATFGHSSFASNPGGPVVLESVPSVTEDYRFGVDAPGPQDQSAKRILANLFTGITELAMPDGSFNSLGKMIADQVPGFEEQYELAKVFYNLLKDDPITNGWENQTWKWGFGGKVHTNDMQQDLEGIEGFHELVRTASTRWGTNTTSPSNLVAQPNVDDLESIQHNERWKIEYAGQGVRNVDLTTRETVILPWTDTYTYHGRDSELIRADLDPFYGLNLHPFSTARQVFLGKGAGGGGSHFYHREYDGMERVTVNTIEGATPEEAEDQLSGGYYPEFIFLNQELPVEEVLPNSTAEGVVKEIYFSGRGNAEYAFWSTDPMYKDGSGQMGEKHPRIGSRGQSAGTSTALVNHIFQPSITGNTGFYLSSDIPADQWITDAIANIPLGKIAEMYLNQDVTPENVNTQNSGDGEVVEYTVDEWNSAGSIITDDGTLSTGRAKERWTVSMAERVSEKINSKRHEALTFYRKMWDTVEKFINDGPNDDGGYDGDGNKYIWDRYRPHRRMWHAIICYLPYFLFWQEDHPYFEVTVQRKWQEDFTPPEVAVFPKWSAMAANADVSSTGRWQERTNLSLCSSVDNLEQQYYQYLYSQKQHAYLYKEAFDMSMHAYSQIARGLAADAKGNYEEWGPVIEQISKMGFAGITPEILDNYNSIRMRTIKHGADVDGPGAGAWILPRAVGERNLIITPGFKLTPFAVPNNFGTAAGQVSGANSALKHNQLSSYKELERYFYDSKLIQAQGTRVCFIGIESGELTRILSAPSDRLDEASTPTNQNSWLGDISIFGHGDFEVEIELFDYFRPWIVLKFDPRERSQENKVLNFSRMKPVSVSTQWSGGGGPPNSIDPPEAVLERFKKGVSVSMLGMHMSNQSTGMADTQGYLSARHFPSMTGDGGSWHNPEAASIPRVKDTEALSMFLKIYANHVLGLNFFEYTTPYISSIAPVGDYYQNDDDTGLPEERNYQEPLRESLERIVRTFKDAGDGEPQHLLKYFYDRASISDFGTKIYAHFDEAGRTDLFKFNELDSALFSEDAISLQDSKFYPFRFESPITKRSLAASEILTSINEVFSNVDEVLAQFENGFAFDYILGLTYKMDDFVLQRKVRTFLDGNSIDIPDDIELVENKEFSNFSFIKESLPYLNSNDGRVKQNSLYPLTLRARIKKSGSSN